VRFVLRPVRSGELEMVYRGRNQPHVRAVMPFSGAIDFEAHRRWWPAAVSDPRRRMLILEDGGVPVAMVVFSDLVPGVFGPMGLVYRRAIAGCVDRRRFRRPALRLRGAWGSDPLPRFVPW
jgi:hypothetical protein